MSNSRGQWMHTVWMTIVVFKPLSPLPVDGCFSVPSSADFSNFGLGVLDALPELQPRGEGHVVASGVARSRWEVRGGF